MISLSVSCTLHITVNTPGGIFNKTADKKIKGNFVLPYLQKKLYISIPEPASMFEANAKLITKDYGLGVNFAIFPKN